MQEIMGYCGLMCSDCPAYLATQAGDWAALEQVAERWRTEFGAPDLTADSIACDGCVGLTGRKMSHCSECEMRACAMGRGLPSCAHCPQFACEALRAFLDSVPEARSRLEGLRASLAA